MTAQDLGFVTHSLVYNDDECLIQYQDKLKVIQHISNRLADLQIGSIILECAIGVWQPKGTKAKRV